jgi:hypothetical protein
MSILKARRNRSPQEVAGKSAVAGKESRGGDPEPLPGYDKLDDREVGSRLAGLSQVELSAVEAYERAHADRPEVLAKLRYMRTSEPLPGYDDLPPEAIAAALADAEAETVRSVRDYERKFRRRPEVMRETARVLPTATPSAREVRDREAKATLLREGFEGRAQTAGELSRRQ